MNITRKSDLTGVTRTIEIPVTPEQLRSWEEGALIQRAMPNLTSAQREFIISGITEEEWNDAFPEEDDDDSDEEYLSATYDLNSNPR